LVLSKSIIRRNMEGEPGEKEKTGVRKEGKERHKPKIINAGRYDRK
jgi:hypothetical protein